MVDYPELSSDTRHIPPRVMSSLDDEDVLYRSACESERLFCQLQDALVTAKAEATVVELCAELQHRFAVCTAHLGVFAQKSQCLDRRLRDHADLQDLLLSCWLSSVVVSNNALSTWIFEAAKVRLRYGLVKYHLDLLK